MITVSSPGKIHLLGEHAVVYGRPALLAAIDKRIYIKVKNNKEIIINNDNRDEKLLREAIGVFQKAFGIEKLPPIEISVSSNIPVGSGLGSSAALSSAVIGALMKFVKNIWNPLRTNELAYEVEKIAHGNPSGADNTTVSFGGLVWFRREFDASTSLSINPELVERVDFLKSIWSLPVSSYKMPHFILLDSGKPKETTKEMVESVAHLYSNNKKKMEGVFSDQEVQTKRLLLALRSGNNKELVSVIKIGERNLEKMSAVSGFAKRIIREIEGESGAAKVSGAGGKKEGSGILLCYHENLAVIKKIGEKYGLPIHDVRLGGEGIRVEAKQ